MATKKPTKDQRRFLDAGLDLLSHAKPGPDGDLLRGWVDLFRELRLALYPETVSPPAKRGRPPKQKPEGEDGAEGQQKPDTPSILSIAKRKAE